jgi:hypothetical protein
MKTENKQYELWIDLPTSVKDVEDYLYSRNYDVKSSTEIPLTFGENIDKNQLFNKGNFKRWKVLIELTAPLKDIRGNLTSRLNCNLVACFPKSIEGIENAN